MTVSEDKTRGSPTAREARCEYADPEQHPFMGVLPRVGFFRFPFSFRRGFGGRCKDPQMQKDSMTMARRVAEAASAFQRERTGVAPSAVTVVMSADTLVITLHGALSPAEQAMATSPAGAMKVQEFHRQLFASSDGTLRKEIKRITGVDVREATAEVETVTGTVIHAFTSGTVVQVFLMAKRVPATQWNGETITNGSITDHNTIS